LGSKGLAAIRVLGVGWLACALPLSGEGVNLSRYRLPIQAPGFTSEISPVSPVVLDEFCRDDDGCAVSLRTETALGLRASEWRLYLSATNSWSTSNDKFLRFDDDTTKDFAGEVTGNSADCSLNDGEGIDAGGDGAVGFGLQLQTLSELSATCVLVLTD
jgi:hypothetical protein